MNRRLSAAVHMLTQKGSQKCAHRKEPAYGAHAERGGRRRMQRARMKLCEHGQGGVDERQLGGVDGRQPRALSAMRSTRGEQRKPRGASGESRGEEGEGLGAG